MAWSDLPEDLLRCISSHLPVVDFLRLSIVCSSWNFALASNALLQIHCLPAPWLLLPSDSREVSLTFLDLTLEEEGCHRSLPSVGSHISGRRCFGSKNGWLVSFDEMDLQPRLFNPIIKAEISLPSFFTIPPVQSAPNRYVDNIHDMIFDKIVISSNDMTGSAVVIYETKFLALARLRDDSWFPGPQIPPYEPWCSDQFNDIYFHDEEKRFYAITRFSAVLSFDLNGQNVELICPAKLDPKVLHCDSRNYIIFLSGTLLKIERIVKFIEIEFEKKCKGKTIEISVLKFMPDIVASSSHSSTQWMPIKDLGDCSLFVGYNETFSLHHSAAPGIKPNCIYFSDDWEDMSPENVDRDAGYFDLHNDRFQYFLDSGSHPTWPPSIWFTPSLS